jgi:23S rRNA pseudouridine1911/1915/1917 synthase
MNTDWRYLKEPLFTAEAEKIDLKNLETYILQEDTDVLAVDKPGWVVCHPSKDGPLSSLVGACRFREALKQGLDPEALPMDEHPTLHLVSRLDRETSGIVLLAKHRASARRFQMALQERRAQKTYLALLKGEMKEPITLKAHLAKDLESPIHVKQTVRKSHSSVSAETHFEPIHVAHGFTFAKVNPITGRKHQIRAHAEHLGYPVVGDKMYGSDPECFLQFAEHGWTDFHSQHLEMRRQALHAHTITFECPEGNATFTAPIPWDIREFCLHRMEWDPMGETAA